MKVWMLIFIAVIINMPFPLSGQEPENLFLKSVRKLVDENDKEVDFIKAQFYYFDKNPDSTLFYTFKTISLSKNTEILDFSYFLRGESFKRKKVFDEAIEEFQQISVEFAFQNLVSINIGEIYLEKRAFLKALNHFLVVEKKENPNIGKSSLLHNIGLCYFHTEQFIEAEKYLLESTQIQEYKRDTVLLAAFYMDVANLYYEQYKDDQAIPYFKKAYQLSKTTKDFELKQNAAFNMAIVEENRKDLSKSLVYRKEYEVWKDSLNDKNRIWALAEVEKKYVVSQKQEEIRKLQSENKLRAAQRNGFIASSILLILLLATAIYFYKQKIKVNKIIAVQKEKLDQLNTTKNKLFSIVSHDLRSSVNGLKNSNKKLLKDIAIQNYDALTETAHKNAGIVTSTYNLLDNLLNWANLQTHQLYFQIESVDLYSVIQHVAYNYGPLFEHKNIIFENRMSKAVFIMADLDSLKIIIRNLFDNAIKFSNDKDMVSVYSYTNRDDHFQYLVIEDTGIGMDDETRNALLNDQLLLAKKKNQQGVGTGLGIQLCRSMISKNKGKLLIESEVGKGSKMIVAIPKSIQNG